MALLTAESLYFMPRRLPAKKKSQFILPPPQPIPRNACWIESDSYDRAVYRKLRDDSPSLRNLEESGGALVPRFDALLQDLFSALFKYNVLFLKDEAVLPSAALNRALLTVLHQGELARLLREATVLAGVTDQAADPVQIGFSHWQSPRHDNSYMR